MRIDGSCHCGAIRFEAEVEEGEVSLCHCTDCQSLTGTAFRTSVPARDGTLRVTAGTPRTYLKTADSGNRTEQNFCGDCGSPLFVRHPGDGQGWTIRWGAIRQRDALRPVRSIWLRSAVPWLDRVADLPGRQGD
jgi:hypothetical protein